MAINVEPQYDDSMIRIVKQYIYAEECLIKSLFSTMSSDIISGSTILMISIVANIGKNMIKLRRFESKDSIVIIV